MGTGSIFILNLSDYIKLDLCVSFKIHISEVSSLGK